MGISKFEGYGNKFTDFSEWPNDKPMDSQTAAEHFLLLCFTDSVIRLKNNRVLTDDEFDIVMDRARHGLLVAAAETVNYALQHPSRKEDADGDWST